MVLFYGFLISYFLDLSIGIHFEDLVIDGRRSYLLRGHMLHLEWSHYVYFVILMELFTLDRTHAIYSHLLTWFLRIVGVE
jgi:hypothetical protein